MNSCKHSSICQGWRCVRSKQSFARVFGKEFAKVDTKNPKGSISGLQSSTIVLIIAVTYGTFLEGNSEDEPTWEQAINGPDMDGHCTTAEE